MIKTLEIPCAGYSIIADWYEGQHTDKVLLILPGFMSVRGRQQDFTNSMVDATGASAVVIEYSGHGDSPFELKDTRPAQHVLEVISAYDWIKAHYPHAEVVVMGNSYGSFLASHLALYRAFETLVLRAPAIYAPSTLYDLWSQRFDYEDAYRQSITSYRSDPEELSKNPLLAKGSLKKPSHILVVVHEHDEIIPRATSDAYVQAFHADSFVAEGFSHAVSQSDISKEQLAEYQVRISEWLRQF